MITIGNLFLFFVKYKDYHQSTFSLSGAKVGQQQERDAPFLLMEFFFEWLCAQ
jgi:hypothetical protein